MANKKRTLYRLHKQIHKHRLHTSPVYAELAHAPEMIIEEFLLSLNPLDRKYAEKRISDARMDVALTRLDQLDPTPWEHQHDNCFSNGGRSDEQQDEEHDVFAPREGFIVNREAYGV